MFLHVCLQAVISIHAPREGGDTGKIIIRYQIFRFQSTPPARGATTGTPHRPTGRAFQSTPPARGATTDIRYAVIDTPISIHAPREGGDASSYAAPPRIALFQSTPPARGATGHRNDRLLEIAISIHAPREGGDSTMRSRIVARVISIHAPREGGRRRLSFDSHLGDSFQSTPPARGATEYPPALQGCASFQSTPPARGATAASPFSWTSRCYFNPRPPRGGRQQRCTVLPADL